MKIINMIKLGLCLNENISINSLNKFIPLKFSELFENHMYDPDYDKYGDYESNEYDLLAEINGMELKKIKDLNSIIKNDLIDSIKKYNMKLNYLSLIRLILITGNHNSYFKSLNKLFVQWDLNSFQSWNEILKHYDITPEILENKIKEQELLESKKR